MRVLLSCVLALVVCCTLSADEKKDEKIDVKKLVGKWEWKEKVPDVSALIEFTKDGKLIFSIGPKGKEIKVEGTYKVDGNKLTYTMPVDKKDQSTTLTITKLTDTELMSKDETGKEETLVRIKDK